MGTFSDSRRDDLSLFSVDKELGSFSPTESEKKLMLAVLQLAMDDVLKRGYLRENALTFFREKESEYLFSFPVICQQLGISQSRVLEHIGLAKEQPGSGLAKA